MVGRSFSQTFLAVVESRGVSLNQLATWLTDHDCPIHRSTLGRWRDGDDFEMGSRGEDEDRQG